MIELKQDEFKMVLIMKTPHPDGGFMTERHNLSLKELRELIKELQQAEIQLRIFYKEQLDEYLYTDV